MHNALGLDEKLFLLKADVISANTNMLRNFQTACLNSVNYPIPKHIGICMPIQDTIENVSFVFASAAWGQDRD